MFRGIDPSLRVSRPNGGDGTTAADRETGSPTGEPLGGTPNESPRSSADVSSDAGEGFIASLVKDFGYKHVAMISATQHLMQGFVYYGTYPSIPYILSLYDLSGPRLQVQSSIIDLVWGLKLPIGMLADFVPICGYSKTPYMLISAVGGCSAMVAIGVLMPAKKLSLSLAVFLLCMVQLMLTTCDVLSWAKFAETSRGSSRKVVALVSFLQAGQVTGQVAGSMMLGYMLTHYGLGAPYFVSLVPCLYVLFISSENYMEDKHVTPAEAAEIRSLLAKNKEILMVTAIVVVAMIGILTASAIESSLVRAVFIFALSIWAILSTSLLVHPVIGKVNLFLFLQAAFTPSISGSAFYFYTDTPKQYPAGPHFSVYFYTTIIGMGGAVFSLFGVYAYRCFASASTHRTMLALTNCAFCLLCLLDAVMFSRWNLKLGIPDHAFILGSTVLEKAVSQWAVMPALVLTSQICPDHLEAVIMALLSSCTYLGQQVGTHNGALLCEMLHVQPSGRVKEGKEFENLWIASVVSSVLPMITLLTLPWLIPPGSQREGLMMIRHCDVFGLSFFRMQVQKQRQENNEDVDGIRELDCLEHRGARHYRSCDKPVV